MFFLIPQIFTESVYTNGMLGVCDTSVNRTDKIFLLEYLPEDYYDVHIGTHIYSTDHKRT